MDLFKWDLKMEVIMNLLEIQMVIIMNLFEEGYRIKSKCTGFKLELYSKKNMSYTLL